MPRSSHVGVIGVVNNVQYPSQLQMGNFDFMKALKHLGLCFIIRKRLKNKPT